MQDEGTVRLGLVGLGGWGEHIALAAQRRPDVEITRCYARSPEGRGAFAARHGCNPCADYEEMLADPAIQGIIVMSANRAHREQVVAAGPGRQATKPVAPSYRCLRCGHALDAKDAPCPSCGFEGSYKS